MPKYKVGIVGATGMVGQQYSRLIESHPWFELTAVAASPKSAGKTYDEAVSGRRQQEASIPESAKKLVVMDATAHMREIAEMVDFVFCAVDMPKAETVALEEAYAKLECPVVSNNSANRMKQDVPMVIPELNPEHIEIINAQRKRLGTSRGFIATKSNCSIQSYVPALQPLLGFGIKNVLVCTYQAISGAGRTFSGWPEMLDNCIPYIGGEEEKSEREPMKIWGSLSNGEIINSSAPNITSQCVRVPCSDGHMAAVFVSFDKKPSKEEILDRWSSFSAKPQALKLPSAPKQFLHYFVEDDRPQTKLDRNLENGMAVSIGRLREDTQYDYKFICLSHNTMRGAAGGAVELAELLCAENFITSVH